MKEIKIIPYEDKEKYCTHFYLINSCFTDEEIKKEIIVNACRDLNFGEIKKLIEILDTFDITQLRENKSTIQIRDINVQILAV